MATQSPIDSAFESVPAEFREQVRGALNKGMEVRGVHLQERQELLMQAAVRDVFDPEALLQRQGVDEAARPQVLEDLFRASTVAPRSGRRFWMVKEEKRKELLGAASLDDLARVASAAAKDDPVAAMIASYASGPPPAFKGGDLEALKRAARVAEWLEGTAAQVPRARELREQIGLQQLLAPFRELLRDGFSGREAELAALRDFIGVRAAGSLRATSLRKLRSLGRHVRGWKSHEPFLIHGLGGMGKSTLIARFLVEHADAPDERRLPFAYLDFDRASIVAREPLTLLAEMISQLSLQFPSVQETLAGVASRLHSGVQQAWQEHRKGVETASELMTVALSFSAHAPFVGEAASSLREAVDALTDGQVPFLVVLDTFEEVQREGPDAVTPVLELLQVLSGFGRWDTLRVVVSGRAPLEGTAVAGQLALGDLDREAALQLLARRLKLPRETREQIWRHVGGSPLALKLAATIVEKEQRALESGEAAVEELVAVDRGFLDRTLNRYDSERVAVQLYNRILSHVRDPQVRRLVHPGLILRRITADLISSVLAGPCELGKVTSSQAESLFHRMAAEVSLVTREGDALVHRKDIRTLMLKLVRTALGGEHGTFRDVNAAAVAYYAAREDAGSIVEAMYHRLLMQDVESAEQLWDRSLTAALRPSLGDLTGEARSFLRAKLGMALGAEEVRLLPEATATAYVRSEGRRHLANDDPQRALDLLTCRDFGRDGASAAYVRLVGLAQWESGQLEHALDTLDSVPTSLREPGAEQFELTRLRAELLLRIGSPLSMRLFRSALELAPPRESGLATLECLVGAMTAARRFGGDLYAEREVLAFLDGREELLGRRSLGVLRRLAAVTVNLDARRHFCAQYFKAAPPTTLNRYESQCLEEMFSVYGSSAVAGLQVRVAEAMAMGGLLQVGDTDTGKDLTRYLVTHAGSANEVWLRAARELIAGRHAEWRAPARCALARLGRDLKPPRWISEEARAAFASGRPGALARWLVEHADDRGELPALVQSFNAQNHELRVLANAVTEWNAFLKGHSDGVAAM